MMFNSFLALGLILSACFIASIAGPSGVLATAISPPATRQLDTDSISASPTDFASSLNTGSSPLAKRSANWSARCINGGLAICTNYYDLYCDDAGNIHSSNAECMSRGHYSCRCQYRGPALCNDPYNANYNIDCYNYRHWTNEPAHWNPMIGLSEKKQAALKAAEKNSSQQLAESTSSSLAELVVPDEAVAATPPDYNPMDCYCNTDYCLGGLGYENQTCWSAYNNPEQNITAPQMCNGRGSYHNYADDSTLTANTSSCIQLLDSALSPENLAHQLTAQALYSDIRIEIAQYEDCHMFVYGGDNATTEFMGAGDAFIVGNADLSDAVLNMVFEFAGAGNVSTMAGCGTIVGCPVRDLHDASMPDKDGQFDFRFCVGGWALQSAVLSDGPVEA